MAETDNLQWVTNQDGLENLRMTTGSIPKIADDEVLVKMHTVALNYRDTEGRRFDANASRATLTHLQSSWANMATTNPFPKVAHSYLAQICAAPSSL